MSYRKILVPVTGADSDRPALGTAFSLAHRFGSHVDVLYVRLDPVRAVPYGYVGGDFSGYSAQYAIEAAIRASEVAQKLAFANFSAAVDKHSIDVRDKPAARSDASASYRVVQGDFDVEVERAGRLCDLIVFGMSQGGEGQDSVREGFESALLSGAHAVLLVSQEPAHLCGDNIAIAFDGSAPASHAVMAAMPFIVQARSVRGFEVTSAEGMSPPLTELNDYLALSGITLEQHLVDPGNGLVAEKLVAAVEAQHCDMLVLGGYGHSRLREFILGGVTRHVIRHPSAVAVLMAH